MAENLNDIFADVNSETPLNAAGADDEIIVEIVNSANNARNRYTIYPESTLGEVLDVCKTDLSLASSGAQINFEYNGNTYSDPTLTAGKIGIVNGSKLLVHPSGQVAAKDIN